MFEIKLIINNTFNFLRGGKVVKENLIIIQETKYKSQNFIQLKLISHNSNGRKAYFISKSCQSL